MNNSSVRHLRKPLALLGVGLSLFAAQAAFAQTPATADTNTEPVKLDKFTVTGSFLPVSSTVNASPVVTIEQANIGMSGSTDVLGLLKQQTPFFSGNGNVGTELNNGGAGSSYVALRNLTTLVLLNGQRMVGSAGSSGTGVDLNNIPVAMIDRIEILKDSASTVYGTDAIGGVINVILKKNYNGFTAGVKMGETAGSEGRRGDYKTREAYIMGGVSTDTGYINFSASHFENTSLLTTDRPITDLTPVQINALGFNVTSVAYSGTYPGRVGSNVLAGSTLIATGSSHFNAAITTPGIKSSPNDTSITGGLTGAAALNYLIANHTYLVVKTETPAGIAVGGATALNTTLFGNPVILNTKRDQFLMDFDKELAGKSLEVFGDFLFSQTTNGGSGLAPSPLPGVGAGGGNTLFIPANNPYNVFNVDFPGPLTARTRLIELGKRYSLNTTDTWRLVAGLKGEINDKYSWESTFNYSRSTLSAETFGGANGANMNKAMIPLLSGSGGYVYNAAGRPLSTLTDSSSNNLPVYNFFALPGFNDPATLNAIRTTLFQGATSTLRDISFVLKGKPFELPAGEVGFALGVTVGKEAVTNAVDALFANGLALGFNPASSFSGGERSTKGYFLEVGVPIVSAKQNIPGIHILDLNLADRYEQITPGGNANNPKVGVRWLPIDDSFVVRATYADGFIAPSIISLFGPPGGNSPSFSIQAGNGSAGSGGGLGGAPIQIQGSSVDLSDPSLPASKSKSWTAGIVYSPKELKGLTVSVDYYHIKQDKVGGLDYNSIVADLNAKGSGSIYAQDLRHLGTGYVFADGSKLTTTAPNQLTSTNFGVLSVANNPSGDQWTDGVDLGVDYRFSTGSYGRFAVGVNANFLMNYQFRATPHDPYLQYKDTFTDSVNGLGGQNGLLPKYVLKPYISHTIGSLATSLFFDYIPAVTAPGSLFGTTDTTGNSDTINGLATKIPSYFAVDLAVSYTLPKFGHDWMRNLTLTVGAHNLLDKKPPYVPAGGNGEGG